MPLAPLLWVVLFLIGFQLSLLKLGLFRWCPDAVSMSPVLQFTVIGGRAVVSFDAQKVSFCMPGASTLRPSRDPGALGSKKGDLEVQALVEFETAF